MLKELQEKRIEHELNEIREYSQINPVKIKKISKEEYLFEFSIKKNEIQTVDAFTDVMFEIHMIPNFPITPPRVYCKTPFSFPHICDGRDILLDVLGTTWVSQTSIIEIISKLPTFVAEFLKNLAQGELMLVGQYYLGERYDLNFFNSLPIYVRKVKEQMLINGKLLEVPKVLVISDIFFCLFEMEKWSKSSMILTFWSNLKSLITIKKLINTNTCRFFWRQSNPKSLFEMVLVFDSPNDDVINLVLEKMKKYGINYQISKHRLGPKEGVIPAIDIEMVEEKIAELEGKVEHERDIITIQYLMSLYQSAIEFYSATNNPKYKYYADKIHDILNNDDMINFLDSSRERRKEEAKQETKESVKEPDQEKIVLNTEVKQETKELVKEPDQENIVLNNEVKEEQPLEHNEKEKETLVEEKESKEILNEEEIGKENDEKENQVPVEIVKEDKEHEQPNEIKESPTEENTKSNEDNWENVDKINVSEESASPSQDSIQPHADDKFDHNQELTNKDKEEMPSDSNIPIPSEKKEEAGMKIVVSNDDEPIHISSEEEDSD